MNIHLSVVAEYASEWNAALHPAHCPNCRASFLVPASAGAPLCPNCLAARLEPLPALERDAPPELIVPFSVPDATLRANVERWLRDVPFKPPTLNSQALEKSRVAVFLPLYLADTSVWGAWQAQMGFDYLVASSEERFNGNGWATHRVNETRTRWEARAGDIARKYENVPAPALGHHARMMNELGANSEQLSYDLSRAVTFSSEALGTALVRAPEIAPDEAWQTAQKEVERRAGKDCQTAAGAEHHEQFVLRGVYGDANWTLLLLPMYVMSYSSDDGKVLPVRVNGQTGFVSGVKRASISRAMNWTIPIAAVAIVMLGVTLIFSFAALQNEHVVPFAILLMLVTLGLALAAPVPVIRAWAYNRQ
ncbi:MAG TPA: hypothetical protein VFD70_26480 [Anaerolineae bacterium]|nr:hypothetical protein [Anaerolineae bacterium]